MSPKTEVSSHKSSNLSENKKHTSLKITTDIPRFVDEETEPRAFLDNLKHVVAAYIGEDAFTIQ
ncbi:hypothetical protein BGX27_004818, partial [Mortierella sp. AM989]